MMMHRDISDSSPKPQLAGVFNGHGRLACFKTSLPRPDVDRRSLAAATGQTGQVICIRDDSVLFGPEPILNLLSHCHDVFSLLQNHKLGENKNADSTVDFGHDIVKADPSALNLIHVSRAYRLYLRDCTLQLQNYEGENKEEVQKLSALFYSIELIFYLAEILNFHHDNSPLLPKLQEWISFHFPETVDLAESVLKSRNGEVPTESNPNFWPAVTGLIILGRCKEAKNLLNAHSRKDTAAIKTLRQLLHSKPDIQSSGTSAVINFGMLWEAWRREVNNQIISGAFVGDQNCLQLAELLAGDNKAMKLIYENSEAWYKYLVCYLTYWEPSVLTYQLGDHARTSMKMFEADRALDKILLALFDSDLYQVIESLQEYAESGWAALHLTDLFHHAGLLSNLASHDQKVGEKLREDLLIQFGSLLASNEHLWQMGLSYLDFSRKDGHAHIEQILMAKDPESSCGVETLLAEGRKRNLVRLEQTICTVMSRRYIHKRKLGDALMWAVKADNHGLASSIAELVLREMAKDETYSVAGVLSDFSSCIACSEYLAFLVKYNEFLMKNDGDTQREAVFILMDLVNSGISPPYFMPVLLKKAAQAVKTMESDLTSTDLCSLLSVLEEIVVTAQISSSKDSKDALTSLESSERDIREVLAQSICRAEISELAMK